MFSITGALAWIFLGGLIGWLTGKVTGTSHPNAVMANTGVGMVAAVTSGFVVQFVMNDHRSPAAFWLGIGVAILTAIVAVTVYRFFVPDRAATLR